MKNPVVSIIGGGIAGLTTAIALLQKGIETTIYEAASEVKPVGAGLAISINAMRVFDRLGLLEEVIKQGRLLPFFSLLDQKGRTIRKAESELKNNNEGLENLLIHRAALHNLLLSKLDGIKIFTNKKAKAITHHSGSIVVKFEDGTNIHSDFLIVGDGIHSAIRKQLVPQSIPRYAGYTCWRAVINNSNLKISESSETWGKNGRFGIAPLANDELYWFACMNASKNDLKMQQMKAADLHRSFEAYHEPIPLILKNTKDEQLIWNDIIDLKPLDHYAFDKVVLIGDAAHATTPNLGQGACQAIEDAFILADEMGKGLDFHKAFEAYEKRRLKRTHFITNTSWQIGKIAQMESPILCSLRNFGFRNLPKRINDKQLKKVFQTDF